MIFKSPGALRPLKIEKVLSILTLNPVFSSQQNLPNHLMIVTLTKVKITIVIIVLLDGLKFKILNDVRFLLNFLIWSILYLAYGCFCQRLRLTFGFRWYLVFILWSFCSAIETIVFLDYWWSLHLQIILTWSLQTIFLWINSLFNIEVITWIQ